MSLSQASSPEEIKRELKQQVFLAIQGKYDTRQTSQLIEDMNSIAGAIADSATDEAKSWQDTLSGCELDTTSHIMECPTSISRQDASTINKLIDKGALKVIAGSLGVPQSLLGKSDKPTSTVDMSLPQEFVESVRNKPMPKRDKPASNDKPFLFIGGIPITKRETLQEAADRTASKTSNMDFLFLGSSDEEHIDGTVESVPVCSNGSPINSHVRRPMPTERGMGMADYYLREISIDTKARPVKVYFYATNNYLDNWSEQKLLDTIKRISLFHSR